MNRYDPKAIEPKWQKIWDDEKVFEASDVSDKPKFFPLIEFPYPSGQGMHMGHLRSNTAMDIISRKRRAEGYNVLYPIGWDAFGLPTENYAIKTGKQPSLITKENTDTFRRQLKSAGFSFDWSREINTTDPEYYKWTQWIFLQFFKHNLAYKKKMAINWCPKDKIGLANEEVIDGKCERCGTPVEKKDKEQWMLAITKYADRLDKDLDTVQYLENIKTQQRNWIGRSEGAEIEFALKSKDEPTFFQFTEPGAIKDDYPFVEREAIIAVVKHWSEDKYLGLKWKKVDWETFITGGVEKGQTAEEAARAEVKEETGYKNLRLIKQLDKVHAKFFHVPKNENRYGHFNVFFFELIDGEREEIVNDEKSKHEVVWLSKDELETFKLPASNRFIWNSIKNGKQEEKKIKVFTTRADTLFGVTYVVLSPEHPLVEYFIHQSENAKEIDAYIKLSKNKTEIDRTDAKKEKTGVQLKGVKAINPATGEEVPVWVADYVLGNYGTGAVMAVPAHDERDFAFATKYKLPVKLVIKNSELNKENDLPFTGEGKLTNSEKFDEKDSENARKEIAQTFGELKVTYKLKDWVFSRQRYWGEPIPLVHCDNCKGDGNGWVAVPEKDLPVTLPQVENYQPTDTGESPLSAISDWVNTICPICKGPAKRETDTMPNWAGSSWYYLRYVDPKNSIEFASKELLKKWTPIDWYNGGMEHTTLHLLYSRFWHKFLFDLGLVPTSEPYLKRTAHGMILASDGEKMSKSRGNVVNPDEYISNYGADAVRLYEMFMGPFDQAVSWNNDGIVGTYRFIERIWRLQEKVSTNAKLDQNAESLLHKTIEKVTFDIEEMHFNTAISALMILTNELEKQNQIDLNSYITLIQLVAPFAPHVSQELWTIVGNKGFVHEKEWPKPDSKKMENKNIVVVVQINGKVRSQFEAQVGISQSEAKDKAILDDNVKKYVENKEIKKVIFVPNKLINIVVSD